MSRTFIPLTWGLLVSMACLTRASDFIRDCNHTVIRQHTRNFGHEYCDHTGRTLSGSLCIDGVCACACGAKITTPEVYTPILCPKVNDKPEVDLLAKDNCENSCRRKCDGDVLVCGETNVNNAKVCACFCSLAWCSSGSSNITTPRPPTTNSMMHTDAPTTMITTQQTVVSEQSDGGVHQIIHVAIIISFLKLISIQLPLFSFICGIILLSLKGYI